jgi:hypothetical protein
MLGCLSVCRGGRKGIHEPTPTGMWRRRFGTMGSREPRVTSTGHATTSDSMKVAVSAGSRLVTVRFAPNTALTGAHGATMVDALKTVVGARAGRFGLLADARGVTGTDAEYRAVTGDFFREHRDDARVALTNLAPVVRILAEMFRVGIGLQLKTFPDEAAARAWLQTQGVG